MRSETIMRSAMMDMCAASLMAALVVMASGCTHAKTAPDQLPALVARDPALRARFEAGVAALEAGQWEAGAEALRLVQAEAGDDPIGVLSEVLVARAQLGALEPDERGVFEGARRAGAALGALDKIVADEGVDERVRWCAQLYLASARLVGGQRAEVFRALEGYPGDATMSPLVLERDRVVVWSMLLERAHRGDAPEETLQIAAGLYDAAIKAGTSADGVSPMPDVKTPAGASALYARVRAMEAARRIEPERLEEVYFGKTHPLWRAAAGDAIVRARLGQAQQEESRGALEDIFTLTAQALVEIGAIEQAAELSGLLATAAAQPRLVIGLLVPLTGPGKPAGERALRGALLATRAFDASVGTGGVTLLIRDAGGDAAANIAAMKAAGALAVVGPLDRDSARAHGAASEAARLPIITLSAEPLAAREQVYGPADPAFVFRYFPTFEEEARAVARVSTGRWKDRRVAVLVPDLPYGKAMAQAFVAEFRAAGGQVVLERGYARKSTDYTALAREVSAARPDAVYIPDTGAKVAEVTAFLARENVWGMPGGQRPEGRKDRTWVHYLGTSLWQDEALLKQARAYVRGALIPAWYATALSGEPNRQFVAAHQLVWSSSPSMYEAFTYDAVSWLRGVIDEGGVRGEGNIRRALVSRELSGATGKARFEVSGEAAHKLGFVEVGDQGMVLVSGVEVRVPVVAGEQDAAPPAP
jgi:branched-chain amino acid transport system substrate-binding protein